MGELTPYVSEEVRKEFIEIVATANSRFKECDQNLGIRCLEANPEFLFSGSRDIFSACMQVLEEGIQNVNENLILRLMDDRPGWVLSSFKKYQKRVLACPELKEHLLSIEMYEKSKEHALKLYCDAVSILMDKGDVRGRQDLKSLLERMYEDAIEESKELLGGGFPLFEGIECRYRLLKKAGRSDLGNIEHILSLKDEIELEYLKRDGYVIEQRIDSMEWFSNLVNRYGWITATIAMTHHEFDDRVISCFEDIKGERSITDEFVKTENSGYLTESRIISIQMLIAFNASIIETVARSDDSDKLFDVYRLLVQRLNNLYADEILTNELMLVYDSAQREIRDGGDFTGLYGLSMYILGMTEKLLRTMIQIESPETVPDVNLSRLLKNNVVVDILGKDQSICICYYLSVYNEIGCDWRNRLAHWQDIGMDDVNIQLSCSHLYILNSILVSMILYLERHTDRTNRE